MKLPEYTVTIGEKKVPGVAIGTSRVASEKQPDGTFLPARDKDEWEIGLLTYALQSGIRFIDTARAYGDAEIIVGEAIKPFSRESLVVATKVGYRTLDPDRLRQEIEESCERLGTVPDILFLHDRREGQMDELLPGALQELELAVERGLAGSIGISNFRPGELRQAIDLTDQKVAAYQAKVNVANPRGDARELYEICRVHSIPFTASSALNRGAISSEAMKPEIKKAMETHGWNEMQVSLAAVLATGLIPVFQSHNPEHIKENVAVLSTPLSQEEAMALNILRGMK